MLINESIPAPAVRLVCFPHSGGSAAVFRSWGRGLEPGVELLAVQYPDLDHDYGDDYDHDRHGLPDSQDVRTMAVRIAAEIADLDPAPYVLFGHSLGALVAYETAYMLGALGRAPEALLVSGCAAPGLAGGARDTHLLPDRELWAVVSGLGGMDQDLAQDPVLAEALLPVLRAHIAAHETYRPRPDAALLPCPVRCYHGLRDPLVRPEQIGPWSQTTAGPFSVVEREGDHFHPFSDTGGLLEDILAFIAPVLPSDAVTRRY